MIYDVRTTLFRSFLSPGGPTPAFTQACKDIQQYDPKKRNTGAAGQPSAAQPSTSVPPESK